jgi:hypothetical protein
MVGFSETFYLRRQGGEDFTGVTAADRPSYIRRHSAVVAAYPACWMKFGYAFSMRTNDGDGENVWMGLMLLSKTPSSKFRSAGS